VTKVLRRLAAMRSYQRRINLGEERDESIAASVGMTGEEIDDMYRLLAIAKYEDRYVIPAAHAEDAHRLEAMGSECSLEYEGGPGMGGGGPYGQGPFGESSGTPAPIQVETFHMLRERQTADAFTDPGDEPRRVNLLNWDGKGRPAGLFPPKRDPDAGGGDTAPDAGVIDTDGSRQ
jgi:nitrate reductase beta subunit